MMLGNATSYAQFAWETISGEGTQLMQSSNDQFAKMQSKDQAAATQAATGSADTTLVNQGVVDITAATTSKAGAWPDGEGNSTKSNENPQNAPPADGHPQAAPPVAPNSAPRSVPPAISRATGTGVFVTVDGQPWELTEQEALNREVYKATDQQRGIGICHFFFPSVYTSSWEYDEIIARQARDYRGMMRFFESRSEPDSNPQLYMGPRQQRAQAAVTHDVLEVVGSVSTLTGAASFTKLASGVLEARFGTSLAKNSIDDVAAGALRVQAAETEIVAARGGAIAPSTVDDYFYCPL